MIWISTFRQYYRTPADVSAWRLTAHIPGVYLQTGESVVAASTAAAQVADASSRARYMAGISLRTTP